MVNLPEPPSFRLTKQRALVTGGATGLGLACTIALARAGAQVSVASRNIATINATIEALAQIGINIEGFQIDITHIPSVETFFRNHDPFDIVVNSSGAARNKPAFDTSEADYDAVMELNTKGAYFVALEAARRMSDLGRGSIIQISSQMGLVGGIERTVYCASKHAVEGMVKAMAIEWAPMHIRVNSICPTFIATKLTAEVLKDSEKLAWIMSNIKLGRLGQLEDIMGAVVYLASDASRMVTGTHISVDGGWTAG